MPDVPRDDAVLGLVPEERIVLDFGPVSLQGSARAKEQIREAVRRQAEQIPRVFIREVEVQVEWLLHESRRWGTPGVLNTADVDNIVKPLIDGLCGPRGILIDDCQVQSFFCSWIDWGEREKQRLTLTVRTLMADDWLSRGHIVGVEAADGACWPIKDDEPPAGLAVVVEALVANRAAYGDLVNAGVPEEEARYMLAIAPVFRRAHFERHGFEVVRVAEYLSRLAARADAGR
jgi:Holliday junction resolvase RusA-like endonuclease